MHRSREGVLVVRDQWLPASIDVERTPSASTASYSWPATVGDAPSKINRVRSRARSAARIDVIGRLPVSQPWTVLASTQSRSARSACVNPSEPRTRFSTKPDTAAISQPVLKPRTAREVCRPLIRLRAPSSCYGECVNPCYRSVQHTTMRTHCGSHVSSPAIALARRLRRCA